MNTIKALIQIDYKTHKRLCLVSFLSFHILAFLVMLRTIVGYNLDMYQYDQMTGVHTFVGGDALSPDGCFAFAFLLLILVLFTGLSFLLPLLCMVTSHANRSIYLIDRLPRKRYHYLLSKYLPGLALSVTSYITCFLEFMLFFGLYKLILPTSSTSKVTYETFMKFPGIFELYPIYDPVRFVFPLAFILVLPGLGILLYEFPRNIHKLYYKLRKPYKKGRENK